MYDIENIVDKISGLEFSQRNRDVKIGKEFRENIDIDYGRLCEKKLEYRRIFKFVSIYWNLRKVLRLCVPGPLIVAMIAVGVTACARVESVDRDGNRKVGWFVARGKGFVDSANARAVTVSGFGLHRAGPTWGLGVQKTRYVMLDERCRVVVLKDYAEQADLGRTLGLDLSEICIDQGSGAVSKWKTHIKVDGG